MPKKNTKQSKSTKTSQSSKSGSKGKAANAKDIERAYKIKYELKMIALAAFTLFMMLSLYTPAVGLLGKTITEMMLGLFSFVAFAIPIVFFIITFVHLNPNFRPAKLRVTVAMSLIIVGLLLLSTLLAYEGIERDKLILRDDYLTAQGIKYAYSLGETRLGGGVFGDTLTIGLIKLIGVLGTYILIIVAFLAGFIIFTRISMQDLWELKRKATDDRKQQKLQNLQIEEALFQKKPKAEKRMAPIPEGPIKAEQSEPGFIHDLERMRKTQRKKDPKAYDSDSYEMPDDSSNPVIPVPLTAATPQMGLKPATVKTNDTMHDVDFFDHAEMSRTANRPAEVKPSVEKPNSLKNGKPATEKMTGEPSTEKIKESDIDPQTRQMVNDEIRQNAQKTIESYQLPPVELLRVESAPQHTEDKNEYIEMAKLLEETLNNFNVDAKVVSVKRGPSITMFEVQPSPGVKVSKIVGLSDDIALNLATSHVRIAPIPGKVAIGIEVPNKVTSMVTIKEVITSPDFKKQKSKLTIGLGKDISGNPIIGDLANMPHLLIAGATGSGKSVCVNTIISSILFNARPDEVKFLMIDPKVVELSNYNGIPHLILPVVTDPKKASIALNWAVNEMTRRYKLFAEQVVRDMKSYNRKAEINGLEALPQIVVIIDELADLMMVAPNQVEDAICRLAQMARAAGIHLIVATQRPSVDVITGLIKANIPSRIAFSVSSAIDSRTIIDMGGAEKLLGKGDMLYYPVGASKPKRAQGAFMSDEEVEALVDFIKNQNHEVTYNEEILDDVQSFGTNMEDVDEYLEEAIAFVVETGQASASLMQRRFRVGYNRAARLVDAMEERGIIGPTRGSKPREVLISAEEFRSINGQPEFDEVSYETEDHEVIEDY